MSEEGERTHAARGRVQRAKGGRWRTKNEMEASESSGGGRSRSRPVKVGVPLDQKCDARQVATHHRGGRSRSRPVKVGVSRGQVATHHDCGSCPGGALRGIYTRRFVCTVWVPRSRDRCQRDVMSNPTMFGTWQGLGNEGGALWATLSSPNCAVSMVPSRALVARAELYGPRTPLHAMWYLAGPR